MLPDSVCNSNLLVFSKEALEFVVLEDRHEGASDIMLSKQKEHSYSLSNLKWETSHFQPHPPHEAIHGCICKRSSRGSQLTGTWRPWLGQILAGPGGVL